jgi:hypothetical protein
MPPTSKIQIAEQQVIRTIAGELTGETVYVCENGSTWRTARPGDYGVTGNRIEPVWRSTTK